MAMDREEINRLRKDNSSLNERLEEHRRRYDELLSRLGPSDEVKQLLVASADSATTTTTTTSTTTGKTMGSLEATELTSVVEFLRNEQKVKAAELESLRTENERLKTKCERTEEMLRKAEADRSSQNDESCVFLSVEKHAELVKKVELAQVRTVSTIHFQSS